MPKPTAVNQEIVNTIAAELLARGETPTVNAVQVELKQRTGSAGSSAVVTRCLADWKKQIASRLVPRTRPDIPGEIVQATDDLVDKIITTANATALAQFEQERIELAATLQTARCEIEAAHRERDEAMSVKAQTDAYLAATREALESAVAQLAVLDARVQEASARELQYMGDLAQLRERIVQQAAAMDKMRAAHDQSITGLVERQQADIATERAVWDGERHHLHVETDRIRQAAIAKERDLSSQLETAKSFADQYRQRNVGLVEQLAKLQGALDEARARIADLDLRLEKASAVNRAEWGRASPPDTLGE